MPFRQTHPPRSTHEQDESLERHSRIRQPAVEPRVCNCAQLALAQKTRIYTSQLVKFSFVVRIRMMYRKYFATYRVASKLP